MWLTSALALCGLLERVGPTLMSTETCEPYNNTNLYLQLPLFTTYMLTTEEERGFNNLSLVYLFIPIFAIILYLNYLQLTGDEGLPTQSLERVSIGRLNQSYHRMNIIIILDKRGGRAQDMTMRSLFDFCEGTGSVTELPRKHFKSFYNPLRSVSTMETTQRIFLVLGLCSLYFWLVKVVLLFVLKTSNIIFCLLVRELIFVSLHYRRIIIVLADPPGFTWEKPCQDHKSEWTFSSPFLISTDAVEGSYVPHFRNYCETC